MAKSLKLVLACWLVALVVAIGMQAGFREMRGDIGYLITTYVMMLAMTIIYGLSLRNQWPAMHATSSTTDHEGGQQQEDSGAVGENAENNQRISYREAATGTIDAPIDPTSILHPQRLYFLDNVKIFLTALVVTHHVSCSFGGCDGGWVLIVGDYDCPFQTVNTSFTLLNQAYFMPLFFFISAFFTPSSYDRKGRDAFLINKTRRILVPAIVASFTIVPFSSFVGQATAGTSLRYVPNPGPCWFLFWLLLFNWVYDTIRRAQQSEDETNQDRDPLRSPFPKLIHRIALYGIGVCGLLMLAVYMAVQPVFFTMPITIGSLPCNCLLFVAGVMAHRNGWLSDKLTSILDSPPWLLYVGSFLEGATLVAVLPHVQRMDDDSINIGLALALFLVAGMFCLDMSLVVLHFFQKYMDHQTRVSQFLANAAYTVYLIHPLVVTMATSVFVVAYNSLVGTADDDAARPPLIQFPSDGSDSVSSSNLNGPGEGSLHLLLGWCLVVAVCHLICWPLGWWIRRLPGFQDIL